MSTAEHSIDEKATHWVVRLNDGDLNEIEREALQHWLLVDPRHEEEFRVQNALIGMAAELPPAAHARLVRLANHGKTSGGKAARGVLAAVVAAAAFAVAAVAVGLFVWNAQPEEFATATGQTRAVTFEDGSIAYLNARTRLQWQGDESGRRVALLDGEALFEVMPDAGRPFHVVLRNSEIQVLGTRFNVYQKKSGDVVVTVLEGRVRVQNRATQIAAAAPSAAPGWQRELKANQQIVYRDTGFVRDVHATDARNAVKWRDGVLEMQEGTLAEVVEELTRYTDRPVFISDPRLAELRLSGALTIRDVRAALARIESIAPVAVTESGSTFTLEYRHQEREENR